MLKLNTWYTQLNSIAYTKGRSLDHMSKVNHTHMHSSKSTLIYYCNMAARGLTGMYTQLLKVNISVKPQARLCYNIYVTFSIVVYSAAITTQA